VAETFHIPLNVTRTRVTVLGFLMSVILFAVAALVNFQGTQLQEVLGNQLKVLIPLFLGFSFAFLALGIFIISQDSRRHGDSHVWVYSVGEVFLFVALAQTTSGILLLFMDLFTFALVRAPEKVFTTATMDANFMALSNQLLNSIFWLAAIAWFAMTYLIPFFAFNRIPLPKNKRPIVYFSYFCLLMLAFSISGGLYHLLGLAANAQYGRLTPFVAQLIQPILWNF